MVCLRNLIYNLGMANFKFKVPHFINLDNFKNFIIQFLNKVYFNRFGMS